MAAAISRKLSSLPAVENARLRTRSSRTTSVIG
jgi:hypothetical protein